MQVMHSSGLMARSGCVQEGSLQAAPAWTGPRSAPRCANAEESINEDGPRKQLHYTQFRMHKDTEAMAS